MVENSDSAPKFQIFVANREQWMTQNSAERAYDLGFRRVIIGGQALDAGVLRQISDNERRQITNIGDGWSDNT